MSNVYLLFSTTVKLMALTTALFFLIEKQRKREIVVGNGDALGTYRDTGPASNARF